jgi:GAF domain-containing protein
MHEDIIALFASGRSVDEILQELMRAYGTALDCDRCLLFLRDPASTKSKMTHQWVRRPDYAFQRPDRGWQPQSPTLVDDDPMYAEALRNPEALYIDDVEAADPALVNAPYELEHFGHRALIHAPVYHDGEMWGVLEPCVFGAARAWSDDDKSLTRLVQNHIGPLAADHVRRHCT